MDTYGYLYGGNFYPLNASFNLFEQDDDSGDNKQFELTYYLVADLAYTLVVTTYDPNVNGPFSVVAFGPDNVTFIPINAVKTTTSE